MRLLRFEGFSELTLWSSLDLIIGKYWCITFTKQRHPVVCNFDNDRLILKRVSKLLLNSNIETLGQVGAWVFWQGLEVMSHVKFINFCIALLCAPSRSMRARFGHHSILGILQNLKLSRRDFCVPQPSS